MARLISDRRMSAPAAEELRLLLRRQRQETSVALPHRHHVVVEHIDSGPGAAPGNQVVVHALWGGRVTHPYAMVLESAWVERYGHRLEIDPSDDGVALHLPHSVSADEVLGLVSTGNLERLLRLRLENSGFFGARFRECAGRALLITRNRMNQRLPLWMSRLRSQKLFQSVRAFGDFPILLEAWRSCLQDEFELDALHRVLAELENGVITWSETHNRRPSPFATTFRWSQINEFMYRGDEQRDGADPSLREDLIREVALSPGLRPTVKRSTINRFVEKRQRVSPGYAPRGGNEILDWVRERHLIPMEEWKSLLGRVFKDYGSDLGTSSTVVFDRLAFLVPPSAAQPLAVARESIPWLLDALYRNDPDIEVASLASDGAPSGPSRLPHAPTGGDDSGDIERDVPPASTILGEWLSFYGPSHSKEVAGTLGIPTARLRELLDELLESSALVEGELTTGSSVVEICDRENFEILLRIQRSEATAATNWQPMGVTRLALFLARFQGVADGDGNPDMLLQRMEQLTFFGSSVASWEAEILPARIPRYQSSWLDSLIQETDLRWTGCGRERIAFCSAPDVELLRETGNGVSGLEGGATQASDGPVTGVTESTADWFPQGAGRYDFAALQQLTGIGATELSSRLWEYAWAGTLTNDSFVALRRGILNRFRVPDLEETLHRRPSRWRRAGSRRLLNQWKGTMPFAGNWHRTDPSATGLQSDPIERMENSKDRVRILLNRYGILFRELLQRELEAFRWASLFRTLRIMELAGEVIGGYFFQGIPGPQFISHRALRIIQQGITDSPIFWLCATDPASLCGLSLEGLKGTLPHRRGENHIVYQGSELVVRSIRHGRDLDIHLPPDDPVLPQALEFLHHLLTRSIRPLPRLRIETINNLKAGRSPFRGQLQSMFDSESDRDALILYRRVSCPPS